MRKRSKYSKSIVITPEKSNYDRDEIISYETFSDSVEGHTEALEVQENSFKNIVKDQNPDLDNVQIKYSALKGPVFAADPSAFPGNPVELSAEGPVKQVLIAKSTDLARSEPEIVETDPNFVLSSMGKSQNLKNDSNDRLGSSPVFNRKISLEMCLDPTSPCILLETLHKQSSGSGDSELSTPVKRHEPRDPLVT
jgi:hypothetical protein